MDNRFPSKFPPSWASEWGDDRFGLQAQWHLLEHVQGFRWIEPGEFLMGSPNDEQGRQRNEGPQHRVRISQGFWMADIACTQELWTAVMGKNPSYFQGERNLDNAKALPVESVSYDKVEKFLAMLNQHLPEGYRATLPTEAEWEYACRAGSKSAYTWGQEADAHRMNVGGDLNSGSTVPVRSYEPNAWGLFQMHGNVWEWCADDQREYLVAGEEQTVLDPQGGIGIGIRVLRGGSWYYGARNARSAFRDRDVAGDDWPDGGFRLVLRATGSGGAGG